MKENGVCTQCGESRTVLRGLCFPCTLKNIIAQDKEGDAEQKVRAAINLLLTEALQKDVDMLSIEALLDPANGYCKPTQEFHPVTGAMDD